MNFGISMLASEISQLPLNGQLPIAGVEAVIFDEVDLEQKTWLGVWANIAQACKEYGAKNISFHFPVNGADYVDSYFAKERLKEGLLRASDLGMLGVVVHANRVRSICNWWNLDVHTEREKILTALSEVRNSVSSETWLGIENMPLMDNYGKEIDPSFVFPDDFALLAGTDVEVIFDICHYFNSVATVRAVKSGDISEKHFPYLQCADYFDFQKLQGKIAQWHFSAFRGLCNPDTGEICCEGVLPWDSSLSTDLYIDAVTLMKATSPNARCILEVQEDSYHSRLNARRLLDWVGIL